MSMYISKLLGATEPLFSQSIQQLEDISGKPSEDVRLHAELLGKVRIKTEELGLDPDDTSPKELHQALVALIDQHDKHLVKKIGGKDPNDSAELMPLMKKAWEGVDTPKNAWVLKKTVAKSMLKKTPPKNIMKHLGYRSVDSMLKNENLAEIYGALRFAETADWLNGFNESYKSLKPTDFQNRQIEVVEMPLKRWGDIAAPFIHKKRHNITHLKELGVILMLPVTPEANLKGIAIFTLPLLFHYLHEIRLYSSFFKLQQVKPHFGETVVETLIADTENHPIMAGQKVHWRVIQRYYGKNPDGKHPEIFQPHVQPEDLHWRKAEDLLYELAPELEFWRDLDFVALFDKDNRPVTLNMLDVAATYVNSLAYEDRAIYHFRESLWNELFIRYLGHDVLEQQILQQLDNDMIKPESL